jgi:hypothetical protein
MYRHLLVYKCPEPNDTVHKLSSAIISRKSANPDVNCWVWTIYIQSTDDYSFPKSLPLLLSNCANLRELDIDGLATPEILGTVLRSCRSLSVLKVWLNLHEPTAMTLIASFKSLEALEIVMRRHKYEDTMSLEAVIPWALPNVQFLHWQYPTVGGTLQQSRLLSRCSFPSLKTIYIGYLSRTVPGEMPLIGSFLEAHPGIESATVHMSSECLVGLVPHLRCDWVCMSTDSSYPDSAVVLNLHPGVKALGFLLDDLVDRVEHEEAMWSLLSALATMDHSSSTLKSLYLWDLYSENSRGRSTSKDFQIQLRNHVTQLNACGIQVYSGSGGLGKIIKW